MARMAVRLKPFYLLPTTSVSQLTHTASGRKWSAWPRRSGRMMDRATFWLHGGTRIWVGLRRSLVLWSLLNIRMSGRWLYLRVSVACSYGFRTGRDMPGRRLSHGIFDSRLSLVEARLFVWFVSCPDADCFRFDLIWTDPWPYGNITSINSEECPGLDVRTGLVDQSWYRDGKHVYFVCYRVYIHGLNKRKHSNNQRVNRREI